MRIFDNGSVGYNLTVGQTYTLKPEPNDGYWPERIYCTYDYYYPGDTVPVNRGMEIDPDSEGKYTFTPPAIGGYKFSCWEDDDGNVLGYTKDYYIKVSGDREIYCCYDLTSATLPEPVPVITLSPLNADEAGSNHIVTAVATRSIPEDIPWSKQESSMPMTTASRKKHLSIRMDPTESKDMSLPHGKIWAQWD